MPTTPGRSAAPIWLVLLILLALPATFHAGSNVVVRFATTVQLVETGSPELGPYATKTNDAALHDGHAYNDKAPGVSLLLAPVYAVVRLATTDFDAARHACRLLTLLPLTLLAAWYLRRRLPTWGVNGPVRDVAAATYAVGTVAWAYFVMLFGHGFAADFILLAVLLLVDYRAAPERGGKLLASGLLFGLAIAFEYPTAVLGLPAGLYLLSFERRVGRIAVFGVLGAALPLAIILGMNYLNFGDALQFGYSLEKDPRYLEEMSRGLMGIGVPRWSAFFLIALSPSKGLFFWSPVLLLGLVGIGVLGRDRRREALLLGGMVAAYLALFAGYFEAGGGASLGSRHLVPLVGPLILGASVLAMRGAVVRGVFFGLAGLSSVLAWAGVFSEPQMQENIVNPLWDFALPMLLTGVGPGNLLDLPDAVASLAGLFLLAMLWFFIFWGHRQPGQIAVRATGWALAVTAVVGLAFFGLVASALPRTEVGLLHQVRGNHFSVRGDHQRAATEYEAAFVTRRDPWILYYAAKAYLRLGDQVRADHALQRLMALDPSLLAPPAEDDPLQTEEGNTAP